MAINFYTGELDRNNQPIKQSGITPYKLDSEETSGLAQRWQESHAFPDPFQFATSESRPYRDVNEYDFPIYRDTDADELRAVRQSVGESLMFGAGRLLTTTGTKALSGVSSLGEFVVNSFRAANAGSTDPYADTPASDFINGIEESIKESMPIYNQRADEKKNFLHRAFTDLDFWTNDMVDGAAFMASAFLTGYGTSKILGPLTKAAYANRLEKASKLAGEELAAVESAAKAGDLQAIRILKANALQKANIASKINQFDRLVTTGVSRSVESLMEGKQTYDSIYNDLIDQGYTADVAQSEAAKGAMLVSGLNMLLAPLDYQQYGGWFKTYSKSRNALFKATESGALEAVAPSFGKALAIHAGKNAISEGILEEGLQAAMQNYATKKYTGEYGKEDPGAVEGVLSEYLKGFTTKEGWDAMGAGMILGGLFGGATEAIGEAGKGARERTAQLKTLLANNDYLKSNMSSYVVKDEKTGKYSINQTKVVADIIQQAKDGAISSEMVKALSLDYEEAYKALDNVRFANWAFSHFEAGLGENLMSKIDSIANMNEQELKDQGLLTEDMTNSDGKLVTPSEIAHRYREKAREFEELYNQTAARFEIPNRAVHRNIFEEAVLQKEAVKSIEKINDKITTLKSEIANINSNLQTEGKPVENLEEPSKGSPQEAQLKMLENRKQDLINTLKDSYKRLDNFTKPDKVNRQKALAANAEAMKNAFTAAFQNAEQKAKDAAAADSQEVANFFTSNSDNVFQNVKFGNRAEEDFIFVTNPDGSINPNFVKGITSGVQIATKEFMKVVKSEQITSKSNYIQTKTIAQRVEKLESLIAEDNAAQIELIKESERLEKELEQTLAQIEELKNFKQVVDKRYKGGSKIVVGTKVFTLSEYQQVLDKTIALRDNYQKQLDKLNEIYNELEESVNFLKESQRYLTDTEISVQERFNRMQALEEEALNQIVSQSSKFEKLTSEYSDKIAAVNQKISNLDILIKALEDIIYRKKFERILAQSDIKDLEQIIDSLNLGSPELEFLKLIKNKDSLDKNQQILLEEGFKAFMQENPGLAEELTGYGNMLQEGRAKNALLNQEIKDLEKQLRLAKIEVRDLESAAISFMQAVEDTNKQFDDLVNSNSFIKNLERVKKAFSEIADVFGKAARKIQEPKVKAAQTATNDSKEPSNLTSEEFYEGVREPALRDIIDVINGTAGNNMQGTSDALTTDSDQRLWFSITEKLEPAKLPDFTLRAISKKNNPFKTEFPDSKFEFNGKPVIYLVLYYKGDPVKVDDKFVFTTMHDVPTLETVKSKYRTNMSDDEVEAKLEDYADTRAAILTTDKPVFFKVTGKSSGVKAEGQTGPVVGRLVQTDADIKNVDLNIVTSDTVSIAGRQFENMSKKKGFVLIGHKGQIVNVQLPTMEELPGAVDFLISQIDVISENFKKIVCVSKSEAL